MTQQQQQPQQPPVLGYSMPTGRDFVPSDSHATRARWALWASIATMVFGAGISLWDFVLLRRLDAGEDPDTLFGDIYDLITGADALARIGLFVVAAILVLIWLYRAYANLRALRHEPRFTPGWAVGYWFIPIINIFRPFQIIKDLYVRSENPARTAGLDRIGAPSIVTAWWVCWLATGVANRIARGFIRSYQPGGDLEALYIADGLFILSALLGVLAGWLFIRIIDRIVGAQRVACAELQALQVQPEPAPIAASKD